VRRYKAGGGHESERKKSLPYREEQVRAAGASVLCIACPTPCPVLLTLSAQQRCLRHVACL